jgi:hypothetical protein
LVRERLPEQRAGPIEFSQGPPAVDSSTFKYWAFVSYSHSDSTWAAWLHKAIETYRVPTRLRRRGDAAGELPRNLYPLFRDRDELPSSADLGGKIHEALTQSRNLIVICSPQAALSRWVDQEIRTFRALGRGDRILALIVDGEPKAAPGASGRECFPPALREGEPLAADARPGRDTRDAARLKLIAGILGVGFEELRQRERRRVLQQRLRRAISAIGGIATLMLAYVGVADKGLDVPGAERLRRGLDHYHFSLFRPVRSQPEIRQVAGRAQAALIDRMQREWLDGSWRRPNSTRATGPKVAISPWVTSQAMWAVFKAISPSDRTLPDFLAALDAPFAQELPVEAGGKKFGWFVSDADFPEAEPTLMTIGALATAIGRNDLLDPEQRRHFLSRLAYAQQAADIYRPVADGGWNMFPQQDEPTRHATFATAEALLALIELRHAHLDWEGNAAQVDAMLRATSDWLVNQFDATSNPPGWHADPGQGPVADGLTLEIYAELLRCEDEDGISLPAAILQAIPDQIDRLLGRPIEYPVAAASYTRIFTNFDGARVTRWQDVSFIWLPYAIDVAERWLRRLERNGGSPEAIVQTERVLGYLVVDLGSRSFPDAESGKAPIYVASETLHALASLLQESNMDPVAH